MSLIAYIVEPDGAAVRDKSNIIEVPPLVLRAIDRHILEFCAKACVHIDLYDADNVPLKQLPALEATLEVAYKEAEKGPSRIDVNLGTIGQPDGSYAPRVGVIDRDELLVGIASLLNLVSLAIRKQTSVEFVGD